MAPEESQKINHNCIKTESIAKLETKVESLVNTVFGYGKDKGLNATVLILNETVLIFSQNTRDLITSVNALVRFHDEFKVKEEEKLKYKAELEAARIKLEEEKEKNTKEKRARTTSIIALVAIIVTLIVAYVKTVV